MRTRRNWSALGLALVAGIAANSARAQDTGTLDKERAAQLFPAKAPYSPYAGRAFPTRPLFGDTHLHTSFSMDAGAFGARVDPVQAYRLAKGEEITASSGQSVKLSRPLDFLVVADHSDGMGFFPLIFSGSPEIMADPQGRKWNQMINGGQGADAAIDIIRNFGAGTISRAIFPTPGTPAYRGAWQKTIEAAEQANEPGHFTAFIGFEWTSNTGGNNLHRNVIFREDGARAGLTEPYTTMKPLGSDDPRDLWKWMAATEAKTGSRVLAIAHNGNLSNGLMFPIIEPVGGKPLDRAYAETRTKWERLYEATQIKGDGETHPTLSPNDEFANFERWDKGNLDLTVAKKPEMLEFEYARSALMNGLRLEQKLGVNPFKFGMIGSTDAHTGLAAIEEDNFWGKTSSSEPNEKRASHPWVSGPAGTIMGWEQTASGYAAVWATENTRASLWDAMERRETYATTGSRMVVRFFGGFDFTEADVHTRLPGRVGYEKGVPMGGDLRSAPNGEAPTFLVAAAKDPFGANLDRYQIVKGWLDAKGAVHEKVYDVAWSDPETRKPGADGKLPAVGNTVDAKNVTWSNSIGTPELIAVWSDPDFDPKQRAFYYGRVIEIPTPRWVLYDAKYYGIELPPDAVTTTTERAYTSPIWYTP
ncbi:MAG TPA: DUF3604 domain-containing protein [Myxococcota bacterium]|nr:DUF3604 domain-containing protein [Myxococcota bacterium]